ncbi:recombinase family protein [Roseibium sp.]|uniref:recombinase family protein n=1 Tax=Roseibium sp. TaxID=1936156 RepID=UPI001AFCEE77|nr:recombinase family protein [Roseibium sp.]MBO6858360.1 recombinase family protein [Roseibium sp.]
MDEVPYETRVYGYARVSTDDQELRHQLQALNEYGCAYVFEEKQSGKNMKRRQFELLRKHLQLGDKLVVTRFDRLGRNLVELEFFLTWLEEQGIELVCLHQPIDYKSANGRMMFRMMAAMAQMESELASERTIRGVAAAKAAGKQVGAITKRELWETKDQKKAKAIVADCADPAMSMNAIAKKYGITNATLRRNWGKELQDAGKTKRT